VDTFLIKISERLSMNSIINNTNKSSKPAFRKVTSDSPEQLIVSSVNGVELSEDALVFHIYPGGNDTYIVYDKALGRDSYPEANKALLSMNPSLEQGGFLEIPESKEAVTRLQMAGGEFCANALRSAAALIVYDYQNSRKLKQVVDFSRIIVEEPTFSFKLEVSGIGEPVRVRVEERAGSLLSEAEVPLPDGKDILVKQKLTLGGIEVFCSLVRLRGIAHILVDETSLPFKPDEAYYRPLLAEAIEVFGLKGEDAVGLIWCHKVAEGSLSINPVVWVKSINTCFYESACGSGSIAAAISESKRCGNDLLEIAQPSGSNISISLRGDTVTGELKYAVIGGPVEMKRQLLGFSVRKVNVTFAKAWGSSH